jgi:Tfp pilus assembly protein PilV
VSAATSINPQPRRQPPIGATLVELLVALTILTLIGTATLAALLTAERLGRAAAQGSRTDQLRYETVQSAANAPACRLAASPQAIALALPATNNRPPLTAVIRCGP